MANPKWNNVIKHLWHLRAYDMMLLLDLRTASREKKILNRLKNVSYENPQNCNIFLFFLYVCICKANVRFSEPYQNSVMQIWFLKHQQLWLYLNMKQARACLCCTICTESLMVGGEGVVVGNISSVSAWKKWNINWMHSCCLFSKTTPCVLLHEKSLSVDYQHCSTDYPDYRQAV